MADNEKKSLVKRFFGDLKGGDRPGLLLPAVSEHLGIDAANEVHPAIGFQNDKFSAGVFKNSEGNISTWAARRFNKGGGFMEIGLATGYEAAPVVPVVRVGKSFKNLELFLSPAFNTDASRLGAVVGAQLRVPLGKKDD